MQNLWFFYCLRQGFIRDYRFTVHLTDLDRGWSARRLATPSFPEGRLRSPWRAHWMRSFASIGAGSGHITKEGTSADRLIAARVLMATATVARVWSSQFATSGVVPSLQREQT
jgi:hypothetical protein